MRGTKIIVTCEHAGKRVPRFCAPFFIPPLTEFELHRVHDWGAKGIARSFSELIDAPLYEGEVTRLAIDLNRSLNHPELFSESVRHLSETLKAQLIADHYLPFRKQVENKIRRWINSGHSIIHFSIHSFTPRLNGKVRAVELGILYDPARSYETAIAQNLIEYHKRNSKLHAIEANSPYKGIDDGHTTALRKVFAENYAGLEIEYSQGLALARQSKHWALCLRDSLNYALERGELFKDLCC